MLDSGYYIILPKSVEWFRDFNICGFYIGGDGDLRIIYYLRGTLRLYFIRIIAGISFSTFYTSGRCGRGNTYDLLILDLLNFRLILCRTSRSISGFRGISMSMSLEYSDQVSLGGVGGGLLRERLRILEPNYIGRF